MHRLQRKMQNTCIRIVYTKIHIGKHKRCILMDGIHTLVSSNDNIIIGGTNRQSKGSQKEGQSISMKVQSNGYQSPTPSASTTRPLGQPQRTEGIIRAVGLNVTGFFFKGKNQEKYLVLHPHPTLPSPSHLFRVMSRPISVYYAFTALHFNDWYFHIILGRPKREGIA
jgi:hypothetical protein